MERLFSKRIVRILFPLIMFLLGYLPSFFIYLNNAENSGLALMFLTLGIVTWVYMRAMLSKGIAFPIVMFFILLVVAVSLGAVVAIEGMESAKEWESSGAVRFALVQMSFFTSLPLLLLLIRYKRSRYAILLVVFLMISYIAGIIASGSANGRMAYGLIAIGIAILPVFWVHAFSSNGGAGSSGSGKVNTKNPKNLIRDMANATVGVNYTGYHRFYKVVSAYGSREHGVAVIVVEVAFQSSDGPQQHEVDKLLSLCSNAAESVFQAYARQWEGGEIDAISEISVKAEKIRAMRAFD